MTKKQRKDPSWKENQGDIFRLGPSLLSQLSGYQSNIYEFVIEETLKWRWRLLQLPRN